MSLLPKVDIPEGQSGKWSVDRFVVSQDGARWDALHANIHGSSRFTPEGVYTRLMCKGRGTIMSDTPDEMRDHYEPVKRAYGNILIDGLGVGMVLNACLLKEDVQHATVVELEEDVIKLVAPHYIDKFGVDRLTVVHASAYDYQPPRGAFYDMVWHDIWDDICTDNLPEMTRLHRKYGRRCAWQDSWGKGLCQYYAKRERRERREWHY